MSIGLEKCIKDHDTICWMCANAVPSDTTGCSWSENEIPVDGWVAENTTKAHAREMRDSEFQRSLKFYNVHDCPMFKPDTKRLDLATSQDKKGVARLGIAVIRLAVADFERDYSELLRMLHKKHVSKKHVTDESITNWEHKCIAHKNFFISDYALHLSELNTEWLFYKCMDKIEMEYAVERLGDKLEIHLSGKKYLVSDTFQYWIESRTPGKDKKGNPVVHKKRLSGYYSDIDKLFESYFDHTLKESQITGEIEELTKLVKKTRTEIRKWTREIRGEVDD